MTTGLVETDPLVAVSEMAVIGRKFSRERYLCSQPEFP